MENEDLIKRAVKLWGKDKQTVQIIEELAELQKELAKQICERGDRKHLAEETADVELMLEQLKVIFGNEEEIKEAKKEKVKKLTGYVEEAERKNR
jgi:hypothetical protein